MYQADPYYPESKGNPGERDERTPQRNSRRFGIGSPSNWQYSILPARLFVLHCRQTSGNNL